MIKIDYKESIWVTTIGLRTTCFPSNQESDPYTAPESSNTRHAAAAAAVGDLIFIYGGLRGGVLLDDLLVAEDLAAAETTSAASHAAAAAAASNIQAGRLAGRYGFADERSAHTNTESCVCVCVCLSLVADMVSNSPPAPKEVPTEEDQWMEKGPPREAKWWYSIFHTVTAMVVAGVLSLPYAMAYLGWGPGTMLLVLSWCITLNTMWQMIQLHECVPGVRFDHYYDLGRHAFGPKLGPWIVLPQQLIVQVGCDLVYMVTGGKCLKKFMEIACTNCTRIKQSYWICIFGSTHFFLSQLPNFNSVSGVSLAAAIMSLSYSTIAWVGCLSKGRAENVSYAYKKTSGADSMFRVFNALGEITFVYAGHAVVLEIQATVPSTPEMPSKIPMWKGAVWAYFINAICYFPVALIGYWAFGQDVADNVLVALERPSWLIAAANLMVVIHVIGSYQVYAMPVFDLLEKAMVKRLNFPPGIGLRIHVHDYIL